MLAISEVPAALERRWQAGWASQAVWTAPFTSIEAAVGVLLAASPESSVNVRSFEPDHPKGRDFVYGPKSVAAAAATVRRLAADGVHTGNAGMDLRVQRAYNHNGHPRWSLGLAGIPLRVQHPITKKVRKCRAILNRWTTTV